MQQVERECQVKRGRLRIDKETRLNTSTVEYDSL